MPRNAIAAAKGYAQYLASVTRFYEDEMVDIVLRHHKISSDDAWEIVGNVLEDNRQKAGGYTIDIEETSLGHRSFYIVCPDGERVEGLVNYQQAIECIDTINAG